jgi:rSAM/selenodomain-associated transferase 1
MCKPPRPGVSKTRLAASIGPQAAADLSTAFLRDCATAVIHAALLTPIRHVGYFRPQDGESELQALLGSAWDLAYADAGDLGATMRAVLADVLARCPAGGLLMGADIPLIDPRLIAEAAQRVSSGPACDVVIAPSADGGYCLIGARSVDAVAPLFDDMPWSTPDVLDTTLRRVRQHGLAVHLTAMQRDIDEIADLEWLVRALPDHPERAHYTRRALSALPAGTVTSSGFCTLEKP